MMEEKGMTLMPHIKLQEDQGVKYVLLPGDPGRLDKIAKELEDVQALAYNREFRSLCGNYKGVKVMAVSTGLGGPSAAIAVEELQAIGAEYMIRIGSCGALQKGIAIGEMVMASGAVRDDGASKAYMEPGYPAVASFELLQACIEAAKTRQIAYHVGIVRSHDSFYTDEKEAIYTYWKQKGILASDMETAAIYVVGSLRKIKCASLLNVVVASEDDLKEQINDYTHGEENAMRGERNEILIALEAFVRIDRQNKER